MHAANAPDIAHQSPSKIGEAETWERRLPFDKREKENYLPSPMPRLVPRAADLARRVDRFEAVDS